MIQPRRAVPASGIRAYFDRAAALERAGRDVLRLDVGQPLWKLAPGAEEAAAAALARGENNYTANRGLPELRAALAADLERATGRAFEPDAGIIVTAGASEAIAMAALALTGEGDEVIVPRPAWSHYDALFQIAGATVMPLATDPATGFAIDPDALRSSITPRTRVLVLNSPGNPTGAIQPQQTIEAVAAIAREHGLLVLADDVYAELAFTAPHMPIARALGDYDGLLQVGSLSKSDAMTGWRIGWVAAAPRVAEALARVHQYLTICAVSFAQRGAVAALTHPGRTEHLREMRAAFAERRELWVAALDGMEAVQLPFAPHGAIYLFPRIDFRDLDSHALCEWLLDEHGLALVPGSVFGDGYEQHVRISYGAATDVQRRAAERLAAALSG